MNDINTYNERMSRSLVNKVFFLDKIPGAKLILDFGCADGALAELIHHVNPDIDYLGYDRNPSMIRKARERNIWGAMFTDNPEHVKNVCGSMPRDSVAVLFSSVLHEVFSADDWKDEAKSIVSLLSDVRPAYIIVRDMMYQQDDDWRRPASNAALDSVLGRLCNVIHDVDALVEFERVHGSISSDRKHFLHFCMKYQFRDNWDDEMKENYFACTNARLSGIIGALPFRMDEIYWNNYVLPWLRHYIEKTFGVDIGHGFTTHTQRIFRVRSLRDGCERL